jgi:hypothetical protein
LTNASGLIDEIPYYQWMQAHHIFFTFKKTDFLYSDPDLDTTGVIGAMSMNWRYDKLIF